MINLTENASQRIHYLIAQEADNQAWNLRLSVSGGGCFGFKYEFTLDNTVQPDDQIFKTNDVGLIIDPVSLSLLEGSVVDYVEDLSSSSFVIKNPNATSGCGCGNSFSV
jgi:iron-sulfur cluster insertion protein